MPIERYAVQSICDRSINCLLGDTQTGWDFFLACSNHFIQDSPNSSRPSTLGTKNRPAYPALARDRRNDVRRIDYSTVRPHRSIGNQTPTAFAAASVFAIQCCDTLRHARCFVPRPVVQTEPMGSNSERTLAPNEWAQELRLIFFPKFPVMLEPASS